MRANLPTAIAFQTRTDVESRVILGCKGAEDLDRPGLALAFLDGAWRQIQTLRAEPDAVRTLVDRASAPDPEILAPIEQDLVRFALEELEGAFLINHLYEAFKGEISRRQLVQLAQRWEDRGWLTEPQRDADGHKLGRQVSPELEALAQAGDGGHVVTSVPSRDEGTWRGHVGGTEAELPPFLAARRRSAA